MERINRARAYPERSFHSLVTLNCLVVWGLGLEPTAENLAYEETICRSKHRPNFFFFNLYIYIYITNFVFFIIGLATMKENKEKAITSGTEGEKDV